MSNNKIEGNELVFAKTNPNATIPSKENENAGYDVYACFNEDYIIIPAHTTKLISTGIASAMSPKYEIRLRDRGSNGSKGIHVNAGTIDSGYRGEWFVAWCNTNDCDVILSKINLHEMLNKYAIDNLGETIIPIDCSSPIDSDNFYKYTCSEGIIFYPYTKAIAQAEVCAVPIMNVYEVSYDNLLKYESKRGYGALGSTQK